MDREVIRYVPTRRSGGAGGGTTASTASDMDDTRVSGMTAEALRELIRSEIQQTREANDWRADYGGGGGESSRSNRAESLSSRRRMAAALRPVALEGQNPQSLAAETKRSVKGRERRSASCSAAQR